MNHKEYHRAYYFKRRQKIINYLGGKCVKCGATQNLHFDHIDKKEKSFNLSSNLTLESIKDEIDKCQLLCEKHHLEKTSHENSGFAHGTTYSWMKKKCLCKVCLEAKNKWNQARNAKRRKAGVGKIYNLPTECGTYLSYCRGCKCIKCKKAKADYERNRKNNKPT
jgi:hypothetical protein